MESKAGSGILLHGPRLIAARLAWFTVATLTMILFIAALRARVPGILNTPSLVVEYGGALEELGLSMRFLAYYITTLEVVFAALYFLCGTVLFLRKSDDGMVIFFSLILIAVSVSFTDFATSLREMQPGWRVPVLLMRAVAYSSIVIFYYIFPDGRFVPRWTWLLAAVWSAFTFSWLFFPDWMPPSRKPELKSSTDILLFFWQTIWIGTGALAHFARYWRETRLTQRQQAKWILFGFTAMFFGVLLVWGPLGFFPALRTPGTPSLLYELFVIPATLLSVSMMPVSIGFSILRYRLWDIDVLINRTLIYAAVTTAAGLVYLVVYSLSFVLLQVPLRVIFHDMTDQGSSLAIVVSVLATAALLSPLRRRIRAIIDRRFYRRRYNAEVTSARFSSLLRQQLELETLSGSLLRVVEETMQPEHLSLWLRVSV